MIEASINLSNILKVLEKQQLISLETSLRLYCKDARFKPVERFLEGDHSLGSYITRNHKLAKQFWTPEIFIDKAKMVRTPVFFVQPAYLRFYNDSMVKFPLTLMGVLAHRVHMLDGLLVPPSTYPST